MTLSGSMRERARARERERRKQGRQNILSENGFLSSRTNECYFFSVRPRAAEMMSVDIVSLVGVCVLADGERDMKPGEARSGRPSFNSVSRRV